MTLIFLYADPGSGTMLVQLLLATIAGAGFYFRSFFYRLLGGKKREGVAENSGEKGNK